MNLRWFLFAISVALYGFAIFSNADKPNILFIFTDDQRARTISCYPEAYGWTENPNIDRLVESGIRFDQAYMGVWCMPVRVKVMTNRI